MSAERYIRAAGSSHLEWRPTIADIDRIVAAGMVRETLATRLIRLQSCFDAFAATNEGPVMLGILRGYPETLGILTAHARQLAEHRADRAGNSAVPVEEVDRIAYAVLSLFVNPNCPTCDGTGFTGSYGSARPVCSDCKGSKKRSLKWPSAEANSFVRLLQTSMDEKVSNGLNVMQRYLKD